MGHLVIFCFPQKRTNSPVSSLLPRSCALSWVGALSEENVSRRSMNFLSLHNWPKRVAHPATSTVSSWQLTISIQEFSPAHARVFYFGFSGKNCLNYGTDRARQLTRYPSPRPRPHVFLSCKTDAQSKHFP